MEKPRNGEVYVNGVHRGRLSAAQLADLDRYMKESSEWSIKMQEGVYEQIETSIKNFMKKQRDFWGNLLPTSEHREERVASLSPEVLSKDVALPDGVGTSIAPNPPDFCRP
ncbi:unnamed protein product [Enterobius vermicularis]|uniref:Pepsin-I3 domain-containing protein n=1 Tax=Enterobius vermicularis TaxID=51028 RepID=A0A0N4VDV2_ENTVE|nr:unnamed protein product [Enterobius vermicularis]